MVDKKNEVMEMMNQNYAQNDVMEAMKQAAVNITAISQQLGVVAGQIVSLQAENIDQNNRITDLELWKTHHDETDRVSRDQARRIKNAIHARVNHVLGLELKGGLVAKECMDIDKKYRSAFYRKCYIDARKYSNLGDPYTETCKKDYQACLDYFETWVPECEYDGKIGTGAYLAYLDDRRNAG